MEVLNENFNIDFSKYKTFIEKGNEKEILLESIITASIIHLNISLEDLFKNSSLSLTIQNILKNENYIGLINQVKTVINYYFGEKIYKTVVNRHVVEKIKSLAYTLYLKFIGSADSFNEMKPKASDVIIDLEVLINEHFMLDCDKNVNRTLNRKLPSIGYVNKSRTLTVKKIDTDIPWKTVKNWKNHGKIDFEKKPAIVETKNLNLSTILNEKYKWTKNSFQYYLRNKIDENILIRDDLTILCPEGKVSNINEIIYREISKIKKCLISEIRVLQHPNYDIGVVVGTSFETLDIVEKDYYCTAFLKATCSDHLFYNTRYQNILDKIVSFFGSSNYFYLSHINNLGLCANIGEKLTIGFVDFSSPCHIDKIKKFQYKGITLKAEKYIPHLETIHKFEKNSRAKLFTFSDKTFKIQPEYFRHLKYPLEKFISTINHSGDWENPIIILKENGRVIINRTKESNYSYKEIYEKIFRFIQPFHLETNKDLCPNNLIRRRLEKIVQRSFKVYAKVHKTDWIVKGSQRNISMARTYLRRYETGEVETYEKVHIFKNKTELKSAILSNGSKLNEMKEILIDWEDFSLIILKHSSDNDKVADLKNLFQARNKSIVEETKSEEKNDEGQEKTFQCRACWEKFEVSRDLTLCNHSQMCTDCFKQSLSSKTDGNKQLLLNIDSCCCGQPLPISYIMARAEGYDFSSLIEKSFNRFLVRLNKNDILRICPNEECNLGPVVRRNMTCLKCLSKICSFCENISHPGTKCEINSSISAFKADYVNWGSKLKSLPFRYCPCCNYAVERNGGCRIVYCHSCLVYFCWDCIKFTHDNMSKVMNHRCSRDFSFK